MATVLIVNGLSRSVQSQTFGIGSGQEPGIVLTAHPNAKTVLSESQTHLVEMFTTSVCI